MAVFRRVLLDRKSTRLNSSHTIISYAVFCLEKKKDQKHQTVETARSVPLIPNIAVILPADPEGTARAFVAAMQRTFFFLIVPATPEIYPLSHHAALPI